MEELEELINNIRSNPSTDSVHLHIFMKSLLIWHLKEILPEPRIQERTQDLEQDWYENGGFNDCRSQIIKKSEELLDNKE